MSDSPLWCSQQSDKWFMDAEFLSEGIADPSTWTPPLTYCCTEMRKVRAYGKIQVEINTYGDYSLRRLHGNDMVFVARIGYCPWCGKELK